MDNDKTEVLAGRIEALSRAVLQLAASLEVHGLIDGPRLSALWRGAVKPRSSDTVTRQVAHSYLQELTALLDDARDHRQSLVRPAENQPGHAQ
jgi:hypothetical protein